MAYFPTGYINWLFWLDVKFQFFSKLMKEDKNHNIYKRTDSYLQIEALVRCMS